MSDGMKRCGHCKLAKDLAAFKKDYRTRSGYGSWCRPCDNANHRERRKLRSSQQLKHDRLRGIQYNRIYHYGLLSEAYAALTEKQGGVCAICHKPETRIIKGTLSTLSVDHNHKDNRIRGLLCDVCNKVLGLFADNPHLFRTAAMYLEST